MEEKSQKMKKFEELAEKRVNEAIRRIRLIGNLANTSRYEYTDKHISQMMRALKKEIKDAESRFENRGKTDESFFEFTV